MKKTIIFLLCTLLFCCSCGQPNHTTAPTSSPNDLSVSVTTSEDLSSKLLRQQKEEAQKEQAKNKSSRYNYCSSALPFRVGQPKSPIPVGANRDVSVFFGKKLSDNFTEKWIIEDKSVIGFVYNKTTVSDDMYSIRRRIVALSPGRTTITICVTSNEETFEIPVTIIVKQSGE